MVSPLFVASPGWWFDASSCISSEIASLFTAVLPQPYQLVDLFPSAAGDDSPVYVLPQGDGTVVLGGCTIRETPSTALGASRRVPGGDGWRTEGLDDDLAQAGARKLAALWLIESPSFSFFFPFFFGDFGSLNKEVVAEPVSFFLLLAGLETQKSWKTLQSLRTRHQPWGIDRQ